MLSTNGAADLFPPHRSVKLVMNAKAVRIFHHRSGTFCDVRLWLVRANNNVRLWLVRAGPSILFLSGFIRSTVRPWHFRVTRYCSLHVRMPQHGPALWGTLWEVNGRSLDGLICPLEPGSRGNQRLHGFGHGPAVVLVCFQFLGEKLVRV